MERICEYCKGAFIPKRTDAQYCSHSCRQLAYVLRKANFNSIDGLKELTYIPERLVESQNKQEPSINQGLIKDYPSTESKEDGETVNKLIDKVQEPPINQGSIKDYPSITREITVKKENELSVNPSIIEQGAVRNNSKIDTPAVNIPIKISEQPEKYVEYTSPLIDEIVELTEERNHHGTLYSFLHNRKESFAYWISLRYRCLLECILALSEMQSIELDGLKEICNALTDVIQSRSFQCMIPEYPYLREISWLRDTIKNLCINTEEETLTFRLKKETKIKLIAARWELSNYVPKVGFDQLNFKE